MKLLTLMLCLLLLLPQNAAASELTAPTVPRSGAQWMPQETDSFGEALMELVQNVVCSLRPDLREAAGLSLAAIAIVLLVSVLKSWEGGSSLVELAGCAATGATLLLGTNALIGLAGETIEEMSQYGKLLLPVMTAAMAAQGAVSSSTALYAGTAFFDSLLASLISRVLKPMVSLYLALCIAKGALGQEVFKAMAEALKSFVSWCLKLLLTVFTSYMTITGVVSGSADAAAVKVAKVTISTAVPVVGGILSDASEAVLVSVGLMKSAAGVYGILATLSLFLFPFLRIGIHYLLLKLTAALSASFGCKAITGLIGDFSTAMGLLLAMTGSVCLLLLISTVCFLKGVG